VVKIAGHAHNRLGSPVVALGRNGGLPAIVDEPTCQRPGTFAHVRFGVPVGVPEREQFHEFARQVLVRSPGTVTDAVQPVEDRGIGQHRGGQRAEVTPV
jgi:hypothetical protein